MFNFEKKEKERKKKEIRINKMKGGNQIHETMSSKTFRLEGQSLCNQARFKKKNKNKGIQYYENEKQKTELPPSINPAKAGKA